MDGIVMGPAHCAANNCTAELLSAHGEAFCPTHVTQFGNQCRIVGCRNTKVQNTQACSQHQQEWPQHQQSRTKSTLSGVRRMLNRQHENLAWNHSVERPIQPHDENAPEVQRKIILVQLVSTVLRQFVLLVVLLLHGQSLINLSHQQRF